MVLFLGFVVAYNREATMPGIAKRIVLVEDNPSDVFLLERALDEHAVGYSIEIMRDGEQALRYLDNLKSNGNAMPDLIILDLNLPRHDGIEVLVKCRAVEELAHVPVMILTSSDSPKERERAEQLGVCDYVRKPILLDEFMAVGGRIKQVLAGRSAGMKIGS